LCVWQVRADKNGREALNIVLGIRTWIGKSERGHAIEIDALYSLLGLGEGAVMLRKWLKLLKVVQPKATVVPDRIGGESQASTRFTSSVSWNLDRTETEWLPFAPRLHRKGRRGLNPFDSNLFAWFTVVNLPSQPSTSRMEILREFHQSARSEHRNAHRRALKEGQEAEILQHTTREREPKGSPHQERKYRS
jgi:hypothetical protein